MKKLFLLLIPITLLTLCGCTCKPIIKEVEITEYMDRYFYTGFETEYKIGEKGFVFNEEIQGYEKVSICGFIIINNEFEQGEYSYMVSKEGCYDSAKKYEAMRYNISKVLQ